MFILDRYLEDEADMGISMHVTCSKCGKKLFYNSYDDKHYGDFIISDFKFKCLCGHKSRVFILNKDLDTKSIKVKNAIKETNQFFRLLYICIALLILLGTCVVGLIVYFLSRFVFSSNISLYISVTIGLILSGHVNIKLANFRPKLTKLISHSMRLVIFILVSLEGLFQSFSLFSPDAWVLIKNSVYPAMITSILFDSAYEAFVRYKEKE